jgi:ankyrin repeat protein
MKKNSDVSAQGQLSSTPAKSIAIRRTPPLEPAQGQLPSTPAKPIAVRRTPTLEPAQGQLPSTPTQSIAVRRTPPLKPIQVHIKLKPSSELEKALHQAAAEDDIAKIDNLVCRGANIHAKEIKPLRISMRYSLFRLSIGIKPDSGLTVLHKAAAKGHIRSIDYLITTYGMDVNEQTENGETAYTLAVTNDQKKAANYLLKKYRIKLNSSPRLEQALHRAASNGDNDGVEYSLRCGADVHAKGHRGSTALHYAAENGRILTTGCLVSIWQMDSTVKDDNGCTLVHRAGAADQIIMLDHVVLDYKLDVHAEDKMGRTALHWTAKKGKGRTISHLLSKHQMDLYAKDRRGYTVLNIAAENGRNKLIRDLVSTHEMNINAKTKMGETILHNAVKNDKVKSIKMLLVVYQMDVNIQDCYCRTALHKAAIYGHKEVTQYLCEHGADETIMDYRGRTYLDYGRLMQMYHLLEDEESSIDLMAEALEQEDFDLLIPLVREFEALKAWSFIGIDLPLLELQEAILKACGIILDVDDLFNTSLEHLRAYELNPYENRLYIHRLYLGVERLLRRWQNNELRDLKAEEALSKEALPQLQILWQEKQLPQIIMDAISQEQVIPASNLASVLMRWRNGEFRNEKIDLLELLLPQWRQLKVELEIRKNLSSDEASSIASSHSSIHRHGFFAVRRVGDTSSEAEQTEDKAFSN